MTKSIKLIIGSARENRVGPKIADWVAKKTDDAGINFEIIDVKELGLPAFDAPTPPSYGPTEVPEGQAWAKTVTETDAFIFVTPEYNRSIPSSLKNAIDYLAPEWKGKKAVIVSYGYIDGGLSATRHLRDVFDWLKIDTIDPTVALQLNRDVFDEDGNLVDADASFAEGAKALTEALEQLTGTHAAVETAAH